MKPRSYSPETLAELDLAVHHLKSAAALLRMARYPTILKKVRAALRSAEGAAFTAHRSFRDDGISAAS